MTFILPSWAGFVLISSVSQAVSGTLGQLLYHFQKLPSNPLVRCLPVVSLSLYNHLAYTHKLSLAEFDYHTDVDKNTQHES